LAHRRAVSQLSDSNAARRRCSDVEMGRSRSGNNGLTELEPSPVDGGTGINGEGVCPERRPERKPQVAASTPDGLGVNSLRSGGGGRRIGSDMVDLCQAAI
jgi:hypothetical protein